MAGAGDVAVGMVQSRLSSDASEVGQAGATTRTGLVPFRSPGAKWPGTSTAAGGLPATKQLFCFNLPSSLARAALKSAWR